MNDVKGQLAALRDLGALPPDTDLDAVIVDLGLDRPPIDPTTLTADELVGEIQRHDQGAARHTARACRKELMLFVKNMVFLDGAIATWHPTSTSSARSPRSRCTSQTATASAIGELGLDPAPGSSTSTASRRRSGSTPDHRPLTHRELQERRELIQTADARTGRAEPVAGVARSSRVPNQGRRCAS